jgi:hypothetical protein
MRYADMVTALIIIGTSACQSVASSEPASLPTFLYVPGRSYYHHGSCKFIEGRQDVEAATPAIVKERGLKPCLVCCRPVTTSRATSRAATSKPSPRLRVPDPIQRDLPTVGSTPEDRRQAHDRMRIARTAGRQMIPADQPAVGMAGRFGPPFTFIVYQILGADDMVLEVRKAPSQGGAASGYGGVAGQACGVLWVSGVPTERLKEGMATRLPGIFKITRSVTCPTFDGESLSIFVAEPLQ